MSDGTTADQSPSYGVFPELSHCDLLSFLMVAQTLNSTFLEYTPRYEVSNNGRGGGNALVQMIYLDKHREELQFAFKISRPNATWGQKERLRKAICELAVYDNVIVKKHPNIVDLTGITWSIDIETNSNRAGSRIVLPVLGIRPSELGNLAEYLTAHRKVSFAQRLHLCLHIGRAIETLHSLNIVHGDLKPENVLVFEENGHPVAKLIDFDCSCFGLTDSGLVSIAGTPGWLAPEFVRRYPHCTLGEARKADIYSYGKLCAWILYVHVLDIKDFTRNQGRVSGLNYEYFDFVGVLDQLEVSQSSPNSTQGVRGLSTKVLSLLERVFASTFIGDPARRFDEVFQAMAMLERMIYQFETANVVELTCVSRIELFGAYEILDHADADPEAIATVFKIISEPQAL